jgi:hypothetical protein
MTCAEPVPASVQMAMEFDFGKFSEIQRHFFLL